MWYLLYKENRWTQEFSHHLATGTFMQRYGAVDKWLKLNKIKRERRKWGRKESGKNHNWSDKLHIKPNKYAEYKS